MILRKLTQRLDRDYKGNIAGRLVGIIAPRVQILLPSATFAKDQQVIPECFKFVTNTLSLPILSIFSSSVAKNCRI
jgi:hypothetical protein